MPVYKDHKRNTWYCKFGYTNWKGEQCQKMKRGFKLQREAKQYEAEFIARYKYDDQTTFQAIADDYLEEITPRRRPTTIHTYQNALMHHITPFFGKMTIGEISEKNYVIWQNELLKKGFSDIYTHKIDTVFRTVYKFGSKRCGIRENPLDGVEKVGKGNVHSLNFWTLDEYRSFIKHISNPVTYTAFEVLYYCGLRIGELFALTAGDINLADKSLNVNKSLQRVNRQDIITPPKTEKGIREISLPDFLCKELDNYMKKLYDCNGQTRLFEISKNSLYYPMKKYSEIAGLKKIRVHDLRHSHVALLIEQGVPPLVIAERLGHEDITVTLGTYGHLYPNKQREVADILDRINI